MQNKTHNISSFPEYKTWESMKIRCYNPKHKAYPRYGGRGITICDRWKHSFINFYNDMGNKPFPKAEIDRIDNDGNYEPGNCRWVTRKENTRNRISTKLTTKIVKEIRELSKSISIAEISRKYNIHRRTISDAINYKTWKDII